MICFCNQLPKNLVPVYETFDDEFLKKIDRNWIFKWREIPRIDGRYWNLGGWWCQTGVVFDGAAQCFDWKCFLPGKQFFQDHSLSDIEDEVQKSCGRCFVRSSHMPMYEVGNSHKAHQKNLRSALSEEFSILHVWMKFPPLSKKHTFVWWTFSFWFTVGSGEVEMTPEIMNDPWKFIKYIQQQHP